MSMTFQVTNFEVIFYWRLDLYILELGGIFNLCQFDPRQGWALKKLTPFSKNVESMYKTCI